MPNLRFAPLNLWDDPANVITCAQEVAPFVVANTQNVSRSHVLRTISEASPSPIVIDLVNSTGLRANCLFLFRHNCHGRVMRVQLFSDDAFATEVYDLGDGGAFQIDAISNAGSYDWGFHGEADPLRLDPLRASASFVAWFPSSIAFKSARITIEAVASTSAEIGRIFLGQYLEVEINPDFGASLGVWTNDEQQATRGGSLLSSPGARARTFSFELNRLNEAERAFWLDAMMQCGLARDFALCLFPTDEDAATERKGRDYTLNGKFTSLDALTYEISWRTKRIQGREC